MTMHANSTAAYRSLNLSARCADVLRVYVEATGPLTDRECMQRLGFTDPNAVRPRSSDLIDAGLLEECGTTVDAETKKTVRLCRPAAQAIKHVREFDPAKQARKDVCAHVTKMASDGATSADLARAFPAIRAAELAEIVRMLWAFGYVSDEAGELRQGDIVWHVTRLGLEKLGLSLADCWHVDAAKPVEISPCHS